MTDHEAKRGDDARIQGWFEVEDIPSKAIPFVDPAKPVTINGTVETSTDQVRENIFRYTCLSHKIARHVSLALNDLVWHSSMPTMVDLRGTSAGKTEENIALTLDLLRDVPGNAELTGADQIVDDDIQRGARVFWIVQSHKLARDLQKRFRSAIKARGITDIGVVIHHGAQQPVDPDDEHGEKYCRRDAEVQHAFACSGSIEDVCGGHKKANGNKLPLNETCCPHNALVTDNPCMRMMELEHLQGLRSRKIVVILAGAYFATHVPPKPLRSIGATPTKAQSRVTKVDGTKIEMKLPEALAVFMDEWRPVDHHIRRLGEVSLDDIQIAASAFVPKTLRGKWQKQVTHSAFATKALHAQKMPDQAAVMGHNIDVVGPLMALLDKVQKLIENEQTSGQDNDEINFSIGWFKDAQDPNHDPFTAISKILSRYLIPTGQQAMKEGAAATIGMWSEIYDRSRDRKSSSDRASDDLILIAKHNAQLLRVKRFCEALQDGINDAAIANSSTIATVRVSFPEGKDPKIVFDSREKLSGWMDNVPRFVLDATGDPTIIERWTGPSMIIKDNGKRPLQQSVKVRQISDEQYGKRKIAEGKTDTYPVLFRNMIVAAAIKHKGQAVRKPRTKTEDNPDVGVVMPKLLLERILEVGGPLPSNLATLTFGKEAGVNSMQHVARGIVIGRKLLNNYEVAHIARTVFGVNIPFAGDNGGPQVNWELTPAEYMQQLEDCMLMIEGDGKYCAHPWELAEKIRAQTTDGVQGQSVGRFRSHRRDERHPLLLDIMTSHPTTEVPVHELMPAEQFEKTGGSDQMTLATGGIYKGPQSRGWRRVANVVAGRGREHFAKNREQLLLGKEEGDQTVSDVEYDGLRADAADAAHRAWERSEERTEEEAELEDFVWDAKAHQRAPQSLYSNNIIGIVGLIGEPSENGDPIGNVVPIGEPSDLNDPEAKSAACLAALAKLTSGLDGVWIEEPEAVIEQDRRNVVPITIKVCNDDDPVQCFARIDLSVPDPCAELRQRLSAYAGFELAEVVFLTGVRPARTARGKVKMDRKTGEPIMIDGPYHVEPRARDRAKKSWPTAEMKSQRHVVVRGQVGDRERSPWVMVNVPEGD